MTDYTRPQPSDCPPAPKNPADQPHPPGVDTCGDLPTTKPPTLDPPKECPKDESCRCKETPTSDPNCLERLIEQQAAEIAAAEKAKAFKADLEALLAKARTASQDYTRAKHDKLTKQWDEQDVTIAELIRRLVCALPCWRCVIECYICPLLNELHYAEQWLYGDGTLYSDVHNLHDLLYWHTRDKEAKERRFNRIKSVLAAWEKPAQTIEKALADNQALIDAVSKQIGTDPGKAVYDVFLRLVPLHLAIAPPSNSKWRTRIDKQYTQFCGCDTGTPDNCCGPDVGEWSLRQRLVGPQPYLIDPNDYFAVVCCLVEKRYNPAKDALGKAEADWVTVDNRIKRYKSQLDTWVKSFEKDAKGAIPAVIDCCDFEKDDRRDTPKQTGR